MSDKEIIEKIEAEARKIKPKVLSSKRSAFLNKETSYTEQECRSGLGETIEVPESSASSSHHVWRVCKVWQCGGYTPGLPGTPQSWSNANVITCISMGGTGPSWSNGNTYSPIPPAQWGDDFYDHVSTLVGGINVGDQIEIDISHAQPTVTSGSQAGNTPGSAVCLSGVFPSAAFPNAPNGTANKFCFEYLGTASLARVGQPVSIGNYTWYGYGTVILGYENTVFTALNNNCCFNACYDIGDTGPEGGIIFAVPLGHPQNNGVNQTNFYYEVAKNDIATAGTPVAGFNTSCGNTVTTTTSQNIPNMAVTGIVLQVTGTYNVNIGDEITSLTPGLFPPGTTIASIMSTPSGLTGFTASNPANFAGNHAIILTSTSPPVPWSATGAEWGVYDKPNIITSTDFGTGHKNTDVIDAYPLSPGNPTGGIHPWLDTHDIAATICKQHPSAKDDWFLPSRDEFIEMVDASNAYGFTLGLNGLGQFSEHQYWTSSQYRHDPNLGLPPQFPDKYSWTVKSNGAPGLAYRCHALSVRPIRRFECKPEPDPIDTGIDYDYRLNVQSGGTTGAISNLGQNQPTHFRAEVDVKAYSFEMPITEYFTNGTVIANGLPGGPLVLVPIFGYSSSTGLVIIEVPGSSTIPSYGQQLLPPFDHLYYSGIAMTSTSDPNIPVGVVWLYFNDTISSATSNIGGTHNNGDPILIEWLDGLQNDTAFLIDSNALNAVPYNFSGTMPANYNAMPSLTTQLALQNNITYQQFGTIDQIIDIANDPIHAPNLANYQAQTGASVDTIIKFTPPYGNTYSYGGPPTWPFPGPNGSWTDANYPQFSFVDNIKWITPQNVPNPNYNPSPFSSTGYGGSEIGHPTFYFYAASLDVRGNDIRGMLHSAAIPFGTSNLHQAIYNIKIYDQFEKLICDYDYKIMNANSYAPYGPNNPEPHQYPQCALSACAWWFVGQLVNVNYVDNSLPNAINDIVALGSYFGQGSTFGRKGNGYFSLTLKNPNNNTPWNSNMTRGNTLNLQNWLGLGDHRITDPNNPPVEYNTTWKRFGWGVVCRPCGSYFDGSGCNNVFTREWLAEVPFGPSTINCNYYSGSYTMHYPGYAHTGFGGLANGQGWIDAASVGCPELNPVPSAECGILIDGYEAANPSNEGIFHYDHTNNTYTQISGITSSTPDIARWGNKIYGRSGSYGGQLAIQEWELDYTNYSATHIRDIPVISGQGGSNMGIGAGIDMIDANTVVAGSTSGGAIIEIDISGPQGIATPLFPTQATVAGDIIYMQDTGELLISHSDGYVKLYSYNGVVIDQFYYGGGGLGMYRDLNGDIFISGMPANSAVQPVTFNPLTIGPALQNTGLNISGAAYDSNPKNDCVQLTYQKILPSITTSTDAKKAQNYPEEYKVCYDNQESDFPLSDFGVYSNVIELNDFTEEQEDIIVINNPIQKAKNKRQKFINDKKPKETGPFGIAGYYPLYDTIEAATYNSPTPIESRTGENTYGYHIHDFAGQEYYMPNGLEMGKTQFHGDYDGQIIPETTVQPETIQPEQPSIVTITPIEPEQEEEPPTTTPTYTPPPSTSSGGSGGGGY